ncbi:MAG: GIDE domain-containing protein [Haloarculaceae archaeon]
MFADPTALIDVAASAASGLDAVALQAGESTDRGLQSLLISGLVLLIGLAAIYGGFDEWRKKRLIQDTPTEQVRSIAAGRTELNGTAKPTDGTVGQPFTDGECLYADWRIEEHHPDDDGSDWHTIDSGEVATPFALDDGTGSVRVAASTDADWEISDEHRTRIDVGSRESPPDEVRSFLETHSETDVGDEGIVFGDRRRYTQEVLPPDEEVYVFGRAAEREGASGDNEARLVMERDGGSDRFIISDMTESELTGSLTKRAPLFILLGLAMSVGGLYGVLWSVGIA